MGPVFFKFSKSLSKTEPDSYKIKKNKNVKKRFFFKVVFESYRKLTYGSGIQIGAECYKIEEKKMLKNVFLKRFQNYSRKLTCGTGIQVGADSYKIEEKKKQ